MTHISKLILSAAVGASLGMILNAAPMLKFDGVLGRSEDLASSLEKCPEGVEWSPPKEPDRNAYTSYVHQTVACVGTLAETGELLVGTGYPECRVHRYAADGTEIINNLWPWRGWYERLVNIDGCTWGLKMGATKLATSLPAGHPLKVGGPEAEWTCGIIVQPKGYWLRCHQGWLYYDAAEPQRCVKRYGDLRGVTALVILRGKVYAFRGSRIDVMWLDDRPDEAMIGSSFDGGLAAGRWHGTVNAAEVVEGKIRYAFEGEEGGRILDPNVTDWVFRAKRDYPIKETVQREPTQDKMGDFTIAIEDAGIILRDKGGEVVCTVPVAASLLAAEREWLVAYDPEKAAILRYRLVDDKAKAKKKKKSR